MRARLNEARLALGLPALVFANPSPPMNGFVIAAYLTELRNGVK